MSAALKPLRSTPPNTQPCKDCGLLVIVARTEEGPAIALDATAPVYFALDTPEGMRALRQFSLYVSHEAVCRGRRAS